MKNTALVIFFLTCFSTYPQSAASLKTAADKIYQANFLMDFETIVSYSYPKMIQTVGNDIFLEKIEKHYENEQYRLRLQLEKVPFVFSPIKVWEGKSFCVITCRNPIRYTFETKLDAETSKAKVEWLKETNKTKEVAFEPARNSFNVRKTTTFVAVYDESTANQWKFFNLDDAVQYESFVGIFGESLKKDLGL